LNRFWQSWAFPLLALFGAVFLLFHDHGAGSGASSPEAEKYVVSWAAPRTPQTSVPISVSADLRDFTSVEHSHHMSGSQVGSSEQEQKAGFPTEAMEMLGGGSSRRHDMSAAMLRIEHQHLYFAVLGIVLIFLKVVHDSSFWRGSFVPFLWPSCIGILGLMLVLYTE